MRQKYYPIIILISISIILLHTKVLPLETIQPSKGIKWFFDSSILATLYFLLKHQTLLSIILIISICCIPALRRLDPYKSIVKNKFHFKKLLKSIIIGQLLMLIFSATYVWSQHNWAIYPHFRDIIKFGHNPSHFIVLSSLAGIGLLLSVFIMKQQSHLKWADFGLQKSACGLKMTIALFVFCLLFIFFIEYLGHFLMPSAKSKDTIYILNILRSLNIYWLSYYMIWLIVITPFIEEIFFRGLILGALKEKIGPHSSVLFQAVIFSIVHLKFYSFAMIFIIGVVLGYGYIKSRSLFTSISIHSAVNLCFIVSLLISDMGK